MDTVRIPMALLVQVIEELRRRGEYEAAYSRTVESIAGGATRGYAVAMFALELEELYVRDRTLHRAGQELVDTLYRLTERERD